MDCRSVIKEISEGLKDAFPEDGYRGNRAAEGGVLVTHFRESCGYLGCGQGISCGIGIGLQIFDDVGRGVNSYCGNAQYCFGDDSIGQGDVIEGWKLHIRIDDISVITGLLVHLTL